MDFVKQFQLVRISSKSNKQQNRSMFQSKNKNEPTKKKADSLSSTYSDEELEQEVYTNDILLRRSISKVKRVLHEKQNKQNRDDLQKNHLIRDIVVMNQLKSQNDSLKAKQHQEKQPLVDESNVSTISSTTINRSSSLYSPFAKRPEINPDKGDYYIPLPTVTRRYIDPPADTILESIPALSSPFRRNRKPLSNTSLPANTISESYKSDKFENIKQDSESDKELSKINLRRHGLESAQVHPLSIKNHLDSDFSCFDKLLFDDSNVESWLSGHEPMQDISTNTMAAL